MPYRCSEVQEFFSSAVGQTVGALIGKSVYNRWQEERPMALVTLGYTIPYLTQLSREKRIAHLINLCPSELCAKEPDIFPSPEVCVNTRYLPLAENSIDRLLIAHIFEICENPKELMNDIAKILSPHGRALLIVANRNSLWAHNVDTIFGRGQSFSYHELKLFLEETDLLSLYWGEALYLPPSLTCAFLNYIPWCETMGRFLGLPFYGVHIIEVLKQVHRPIQIGHSLRDYALGHLSPVAPIAGGC